MGARMIHVPNSAPTALFSFVRQNERPKVFAVLNFSPKPQLVTFQERLFQGRYTDYFSKETIELGDSAQMELGSWGYAFLSNKVNAAHQLPASHRARPANEMRLA